MIEQDASDKTDTPLIPELKTSGFRKELRLLPTVMTFALALAALIHPLATLGAKWDWRLDLMTHFYVLAFGLSVLTTLALALRKQFRFAVVFLILGTVQGSVVFRHVGRNPVPPDEKSPKLRILMANIHMGRINDEAIVDLIREEHPDIVGLVEIRQSFVDRLQKTGIHLLYPYRYVHPMGAQGLLLWFREKPMAVDLPVSLGSGGNPAYRATIDLAGRPVQLWLVHPHNPIGIGRYRANDDLKALGLAIGQVQGAQVVIGDLNRTEGSPYFNDFLRDTGLRDSRLGFGSQPSWPSWSYYQIPIDQAFLSADLAVVDRHIGADIGSDHLPVILDVGLALTSSTNRAAHQSRSSEGREESPENLARSTARR